MLEVQLYKLVDAGHFWCKPYSSDKRKAEQYYTLIGKINDYCNANEPINNQGSSSLHKGQICCVKRTSDRCWYRGKILSMFQTINGPQARVLLVDLGERTLVPGLWIRKIPQEFLSIPFQTMECVLFGLKPITLTTCYFDLKTSKQPSDNWDTAATEWFKTQIDGSSLQVDVKYVDEDGIHHVLLFADQSKVMICLNDELVNKDYAILSTTLTDQLQDEATKMEFSNQEIFLQEHKETMGKFNNNLATEMIESDSSDSLKPYAFSQRYGHRTPARYQPISSGVISQDASLQRTDTSEASGGYNAVNERVHEDASKDPGKVRFLSARLPATGSSNLSPGNFPQTQQSQLKPILNNSSGYSSSDHDEMHWNTTPRELRSVREDVATSRQAAARVVAATTGLPHDSGQTNTGHWGPSRDQAGISRNHEQHVPQSYQQFPLLGTNAQVSPLTRPPTSSSMSPDVPPRPSLLSPSLHLSSNYQPHSSTPQPTSPQQPPPSLTSSQSPHVPASLLPSLNQPCPRTPPHPYVPISPRQTPPSPAPSPSQSPRVPPSPLPLPNLCHISKDVFVHGEGLPRPMDNVDSNTFPDILLRALRDMMVTTPTPFYSNVWPAILRGRDVCGIPDHPKRALSYLLPVVTQLAEPGVYSELPLGNGPLALVLCPDWCKVEEIYGTCHKLTKQFTNVRVQIVYAAGHEDERIANLINGCEVIIATPSCFLRMLNKGYTRLDRLCHLIFDGADVMAEERTEDIKEIMRKYYSHLVSNPDRLAPRQCIAIATKWTNGVYSLVKAYLSNPLIVIGNRIESAMFCNVKQIGEFHRVVLRDTHLTGLVDSLSINVDHEIIIFTSTAKDAEHVAGILEHESYTVLLAHEFMPPEHLKEIHRQWNTPHCSQSYPVVVMTDGVIDKCGIRNASCVIHYDFPTSKTVFGKRLFCMAASYPSTKEKPCLSFLFVTEQPLMDYAHSIKEMITRSGCETTASLEPVIEQHLANKEERKKKNELCYLLKARGVCKNSSTCKERHSIFRDVDISNLLPRSGIVKILVLRVWDACHYYVRILEHQNTAKEPGNNYYSGATFLQLALDLGAWYGAVNNRHMCAVIQHNKLCVAYNEGSFYRVKIVRILKIDPETDRALEVEIYFVDRGFYEDMLTRDLLEIAPQFMDIPFQAVEVFVGRVKPLDDEKAWTFKADRFVKQNIEGKELEGRVVMGLRNTIWLDPLVVKTHLKDINVTTNTFNVRLDLLKAGLAAPNPQHFENLRRHFESFDIDMRELTGEENAERSLAPHIETAVLPEDAFISVKVPTVLSPGLFYVRLDENSNILADVVDLITEEKDKSSGSSGNNDLGIGSICVAKFTEDNEWYRGRIISIRPGGEYEVFFADYGDREWLTQDKIVAPWPEILQLPFQAIECSLANLSPIGNEWSREDRDWLWEMTGDKALYVKVKSKTTAIFAETSLYSVELYDTSTDRDVLLNQEIVTAGHAQPTLEFHKTLFPEAFHADQSRQKEHFEEIPSVCLQVYKTQDVNMKLQLVKQIKNIVSENNTKSDELRESGGVRCICKLLDVTKSEAVLEYIIIILAMLASHDELNSDEIRRESGLKNLCYLLTKTESTRILERTSWALKNLATNDRNKDEIREIGGVKNLCSLLETNNDKVQENVCWAIVALCAENNKNCDTVREVGGLDKLFTLLEKSRNASVLENVVWAISVLASNARNKEVIGKQGGIQSICNLIENNPNEKVFSNAIRCLKTLSSYNDENRQTMCDLGVIDVMRRLSEYTSTLPFDTRRLCQDLVQRLLGRAPHAPLVESTQMTSILQEPIRTKPLYVTKKRRKNDPEVNGPNSSDDELPPLEDTAVNCQPTVHPMTMWSQTKRCVTLSIKLRGVTEKDSRVMEKMFYFKTEHLGKHYELNMELYASVLPKESKVHVRGSEVLVMLKKCHRSTWPRLLTQPGKPPYLSVDFDRWDTDSSNDEETVRPRVRVPMTTKSGSTKLDYVLPKEEQDGRSGESDASEEDTPREQFFDFS